jgi:AraC-like DNA-binding protein
MEAHYPERLTNQMFADIADMNPNAFARLFKEETGLAPQRFLMHKRIKEACLQLRYSKYTIDEIAENIGFCDRHYFSRIFTKMRCMSPANFRKLQH